MNIRGFKALRPNNMIVDKFTTLPYDVVSDDYVRQSIKSGENLFFGVIKTDALYKENVYEKAKQNLENLKKDEVLFQDDEKSFYIYQEIIGNINQTGIVATINVDEYINEKVKRHEKTLKEKEIDRINNFFTCKANTEPVFLFQRKNEELQNIINENKKDENKRYDLVTEDGVRHILWQIGDEDTVNKIENIYKEVDELYIADGHHRTASAIAVAQKIRDTNKNYDKDAEFNYFMAVIFVQDELKILPYNRVIKNTSKYDMDKILLQIKDKFDVSMIDDVKYPDKKHDYTLVTDEKIYKLSAKKDIIYENDVVKSLDTVILHENIIEPLFNIVDIKNEDEIQFVGGSQIDKKLKNIEKDEIIILMYPTQIQQIIDISDNGKIMPPKSTWFEPKLRSGLFIHEF